MEDYNQAAATDAVRASYIASLYANPGSLLVGVFIQGVASLLAYSETGSTLYLAMLVAALACSLWRYSSSYRFHREMPDLHDQAVADYWETHQLYGMCAACVIVGFFGFLGIYWASGDFTELASTLIVMATAATVLGKYYGSSKHTVSALLCIAIPYLVGLLLIGDLNHTLMALLALPFIILITKLATSLRSTLFDSARGRVLVAEIADRFNAALSNMPHGLLMIDEANRIEVANRQLFKLFNLPVEAKLEGRLTDVVFTLARRRGLFATRESADVASRKTGMLVQRDGGGTIVIELTSDRSLQLTAKRREKGGAVIVVEDITERMLAERKISHMARYDELTGLQNRAFFKDNIDQLLTGAQRQGAGLSALFAIDVDEFKSINDTYGHLAGDQLLKMLAASLSKIARKNVLVSRFGGDEFAVFASGLADASAAEALAQRIAQALNRQYALSDCRYRASVSIGYAVTTPEAQDFQSLMIRADLALYARKNDKRVPYRAYEEELDRQQRERLQLKSDLGAAIRNEALHLVYQPVIDMAKNRMTACEALIRWNHPQLGFVSPGLFVPLAEEMGIVGDMTLFVLQQACRACARWPEEMSVSVNLSAIDFDRSTLAAEVIQALAESGLSPHRLEVEITETAAIKGKERVRDVLTELRAHGVRVALDDFGVGYSGLSHLHNLPLDRVKIDRSFILAINDDARSMKLLASIISMAQALDLAVTVEGVEDLDTLDRVMSAGPVEKVQGFVFGRHLTAEQIGELSLYASPAQTFARAAKLTVVA